MTFSRFIKTPRGARNTARFVELFLMDTSARELFAAPELSDVVRLAKSGSWAEAASEFRKHFDCDVQMSVFAAAVAAKL